MDLRQQTKLPIGLRSNNPGNLVATADQWKGKIGTVKANNHTYVVFDSIENGLRAMATDVIGDIIKGLNTIEKLVHEYAPKSSGNNTENYIKFLKKETDVKDFIPLEEDTIAKIILAKTVFENGAIAKNYIDQQTVINAIKTTRFSQILKKKNQ